MMLPRLEKFSDAEGKTICRAFTLEEDQLCLTFSDETCLLVGIDYHWGDDTSLCVDDEPQYVHEPVNVERGLITQAELDEKLEQDRIEAEQEANRRNANEQAEYLRLKKKFEGA